MRGSCGWRLAITLFLLAPATARAQAIQGDSGNTELANGSAGPGDFILVNIWLEPDLSDTLQVDNAGVVVFAKLGPMRVTGMQPDSLERLLVQRYSQYLQNPSIRVTVLRRITIWGAVARPGQYPVDLTMSITDALAVAGGPSAEGKTNKVELRRGSERRRIDLSGDTRVGAVALRSGDQLFVPQKSWANRNTGLILGGIGTAMSILYFVAR